METISGKFCVGSDSSECFKQNYTHNSSSKEMISLASLNENEKKIIQLRTGLVDINWICGHHFLAFTKYFNNHVKASNKCPNPKNLHKKSNKLGDREITLEFSEAMYLKWEITLIPGFKLCIVTS